MKNKQLLPLDSPFAITLTTKFKKQKNTYFKPSKLKYEAKHFQKSPHQSKDVRIWNAQLLKAARKGAFSAIKMALKNNADINTTDYQMHQTPLMVTSMYNHYECTELLIQKNANIHKKDIHEDQAIHIATICNSPESINLLIHAGANFMPEKYLSDLISLETRQSHKNAIKKINEKIKTYKEKERHEVNLKHLKINAVQIKRRPRPTD